MIAQINQLIDLNLLLLSTAPNGILQLSDFKNHLDIKLQDATILADIMQRKDLIRLQTEKELGYVLTDFGKQICDCGGWLLYLYSELQANQLQKRWYAINILQVEKETGIESNEETVREALQGDITTKIRIPLL